MTHDGAARSWVGKLLVERLVVPGNFLDQQRQQGFVPILVTFWIALALRDQMPVVKKLPTGGVSMYQLVSMKKIACLRRRLAIEADSAITTALTRLLEKETERSAIAIQKEIDKRDA